MEGASLQEMHWPYLSQVKSARTTARTSRRECRLRLRRERYALVEQELVQGADAFVVGSLVSETPRNNAAAAAGDPS
jgi:hypothetical protein